MDKADKTMLTFESYFTEIGKAKGIEKGKLEGKLETAKNFKLMWG